MQVGELANQTGTSVRSLRYYEQEGLLIAQRRANGYRDFESTAGEQVRRIRALLAVGFTLEDIRRLSPCLERQSPEAPLCDAARASYQRHLATIDEQMRALQEVRQRIVEYMDLREIPQREES